ncbi:MAG: hypothetical protein H0U18_03980 [Pyrinomonadaceae bacterium]|jgi:hypothetical protein|nr:hypothetical protein [Pyrinomonadaceae bacterium]
MPTAVEASIPNPAKAEQIRAKFRQLLDRTNKEHPRPQDVKALSDLLNGNKSLELWRTVYSAGQFAELTINENASAVAGVKECWKYRLASLRKELGHDDAPILEQLLIQQASLCWLKLSLVELRYSIVMKQSITLTLGVYWEKRLTAAQKRFTRACETLARVRKLSRNTRALQFNIAADGGQQINMT